MGFRSGGQIYGPVLMNSFAGQRPKILLLLRNLENHRMLEELFGGEYDVVGSPCGFTEHDFDLCIVDVLEFVAHQHWLHEKKRASGTILLPIVGLVPAGEAHNSFALKFDEVIRTPATKVEITQRIAMLLDIRRIARDHAALQRSLQQKIIALEKAESLERKRSEELNLLANMVPQIVWTAESDGRITYANDRWYTFTGSERVSLDRRSLRKFIHREDWYKAQSCYMNATANGTSLEIEARLRAGTGNFAWFLIRAKPLKDERGTVVEWFGTCTEIEEQKRIQQKLTSATALARTENEMSSQRVREISSERDNLLGLFEASPSASALWRTRDFIYERVSPSYQALFPRKQLIGKPYLEVLSEPEYEHFAAILKNVFETGVSVTLKEQLVPFDVDGTGMEDRYYTISFFQIRDSAGNPYGVYQQAFDNTEQVLAREILKASAEALEQERSELAFERQKLETIFQESPASMALWRGQDLIFEKINPMYQALFGDRPLLDKPFSEALPELADQAFPQMLRDVLNTGIPFVGQEVLAKIKTAENAPLEDRYFDFTYVRINDQDGKPYGVYDHAVDVTERVIGRRELEIAKLAAENANRAKTAFLANMSHEIRTPLGAILGFTDLLRDGNLGLEPRLQFLDTISRNGKALTKIIDDILDLAKVESGKLEIEMVEFSLTELVDEVIDLFRERTRAKNLFLRRHFAADISPKLISDPTRLRQILINLVGNAVKFTENGGVEIGICYEKREGTRVLLVMAIKDTGVGLSPQQRERLFQPFMQADNSTTRKFGGTGLGLSLSQRLAHALGGQISIEDNPSGAGCVFTISVLADLPAARLEQKQELKVVDETTSTNSLPLEGVRILVADDSEDNQFLVQRMLTKSGAVVSLASDGINAVRLGLEGDFDIVLMDIQMPGMDGYEATRALRKAGFERPIIALTAHAMAEERARTLAAGCNGHLTKPLNRIELLKTIGQFTQRETD